MSITSADICAAADQLNGFVGFNAKAGHYIVRFSEDSFGMDVPDASITPASEFVLCPLEGDLMTLKRERIQILLDQHVNDRLQISAPLLAYMRHQEQAEIVAQRFLQ